MMWGVFWMPLHWFAGQGMGGAWVSVVFNAVALLSPLPWLFRAPAWNNFRSQALTGLLLGSAFSLYTVSLVMTDVIHAILLFYLTPVWSTLASWLFFGERLSPPRLAAIVLGFIGLGFILGVSEGIPLPRSAGDWVALISGMLWSAGTLRSFARPSATIALPVFCFSLGGLLSALAILALAAMLNAEMAAAGQALALLPWVVLLALIIFVPPNFLVLWAAQRIDPGRVGILLMTEVIVGSVSAALFSGQGFSISEGVGTVAIIVAGLIEVSGRR